MARSQQRSKRKVSGGRYHSSRSKKSAELARVPILTKLGTNKIKKVRIRGNNLKQKTISVKEANVKDKEGKINRLEILNVLENPANPNLVRRNIITKGTIIKTKLG